MSCRYYLGHFSLAGAGRGVKSVNINVRVMAVLSCKIPALVPSNAIRVILLPAISSRNISTQTVSYRRQKQRPKCGAELSSR